MCIIQSSVGLSAAQMRVFRDKDSTRLVLLHGFKVQATFETFFNDKLQYIITPVALG